MAKKKAEVQQPELNEFGVPKFVRTRHGFAYFQFFAPITGDAVYHGTTDKGLDHSAIITNPDAWENQTAYLQRGS